MNFFKNIFLLLCFLITGNAFSQDVKVEAVLDSSKIRIGEQVKVDLYLTYNTDLKNLKIQWPSIGDTITEKIEVISISAIDTTLPEKSNSTKIYQHQQITISVYDSGYYAIPPFKFILNGDTSHPLLTQPLFLEVHTVPTDSSASKTKDIKPPFAEPFNWKWYLDYIYWGIGLLLFAAIIVILTIYFTRRKQTVELAPPKPKVPPHITALAALEKIQKEQVWKDGKLKEYYSAISDTIRLYIEERFGLKALESTTDEIMKAFRTQVVDKGSKEKLEQILMLSDLVKFAKMAPIEEEHSFSVRNAFDFVNGTKREEEVNMENISAEDIEASTHKSTRYEEVKSSSQFTTSSAQKINYAQNTAQSIRREPEPFRIGTLKIVIASIAFVLVFLGFFFTIQQILKVMPTNITAKESIEQIAYEYNSKAPLMLDAETRLDMVEMVNNETIKFNLTLINLEQSQVDPAMFENQVRPSVLNNVKISPEFKVLREKSGIMQFQFYDKNGSELFLISVGPEDYLN